MIARYEHHGRRLRGLAIDFGIIACERSVPHVAEIALGLGAAVADLFEIAREARE